MTDYEKEIEDKFYQITIPLNEKKSIYGISLEGFKLGLRKTIEWFSKKENLQQYKSDIYNV